MKKKITVVFLVAALAVSVFLIPVQAASDITIDLSAVAGSATDKSAHGYADVPTIMYDYGVVADLGSYDLSNYKRIEISYATDLGFIAKKEGMTFTGALGIKSANAPTYGQAEDTTFNETNSLGFANMTDASETNPDGQNWDKSERIASIDLTNVTYNGHIYLMCFNSAGNQTLVVGVKLIANSSSGGQETTGGNVETADESFLFGSVAAVLLAACVVVFRKKSFVK